LASRDSSTNGSATITIYIEDLVEV
jgi:hypothetical protein